MTDPGLERLEAQVRGAVIVPGADDYDDARAVYNAMHDRRPRAVVRAESDADVIAVVNFARENEVPLAVRGGGHSVPGYGTCDDGLVLDLSSIRNVRVDPSRRTARVGGGAKLGDLDHATHAFGLATPAGFVSTTGVGGLTLGGGIGYLNRKHGLTCDNLIAADVVTADGRRVTASREENPDLFWALRGGGGNFGVVTSFELALHPVDEVVGGPIFFELEAASDVMRTWRDHLAGAPRELGAFFGFHRAPPLPFIPEERHGDNLCVLVTCWSGAAGEADAALRPLLEAGPVVGSHVDRMPYPALQSAFDPLLPPGLHHYWKSDFAAELTDGAIDAHLEHGATVMNVHSGMHIYPLDGAVHDVGPDETAFGVRNARYAINVAGIWADPAESDDYTRWVREYHEAIHPHSGYEGGYSNFMSGDDRWRTRESFGRGYDRLAEVKASWDPENFFRMNQNVEPVGPGSSRAADAPAP